MGRERRGGAGKRSSYAGAPEATARRRLDGHGCRVTAHTWMPTRPLSLKVELKDEHECAQPYLIRQRKRHWQEALAATPPNSACEATLLERRQWQNLMKEMIGLSSCLAC